MEVHVQVECAPKALDDGYRTGAAVEVELSEVAPKTITSKSVLPIEWPPFHAISHIVTAVDGEDYLVHCS